MGAQCTAGCAHFSVLLSRGQTLKRTRSQLRRAMALLLPHVLENMHVTDGTLVTTSTAASRPGLRHYHLLRHLPVPDTPFQPSSQRSNRRDLFKLNLNHVASLLRVVRSLRAAGEALSSAV